MDTGMIQKGIACHGQWKVLLIRMMDSGEYSLKPEEVMRDTICEFGRWLNALPEADRASAQWNRIKVLHAQFHVEASRLMKMAMAGRKDEVTAELNSLSSFSRVSSQMTMALIAWRNSLTAERGELVAMPSLA
jgi:hypothetical protein